MIVKHYPPMEQYLKSIKKIPLLSAEEELELLIKARKNNDSAAREKLILSNLRFVIKIAKQYANQGMELQDLISEGNVGLITAIDRFDLTKNVRLISYAVFWIRQKILQALSREVHAVKVPSNRIHEKLRHKKLVDVLRQELGREPTMEELQERFEDIVEPINISYIPLDQQISDEHSTTVLDLIEDQSAEPPSKAAVRSALRKDLEEILKSYSDREREILFLYHGIDELRGFTLEEIGSFIGLTRERVRQIKKKTLMKISKTRRGKNLREYLEEL